MLQNLELPGLLMIARCMTVCSVTKWNLLQYFGGKQTIYCSETVESSYEVGFKKNNKIVFATCWSSNKIDIYLQY